MRDDYLKNAQRVIDDPNILVNVVSRRVKQLRQGSRSLIESLEKLSPEDIALREIAEGKISYQLAPPEPMEHKAARASARGTYSAPPKAKADPTRPVLPA